MDYSVNYNILVNTNNAPQALTAFEQAVAPLQASAKTLDTLSKSLSTFKRATKNIQPVTLNINIAKGVEQRLDGLLAKIRQIRRESRTMVAGGTVGSANRGTAARNTTARAATSSYVAPPKTTAAVKRPAASNLGYKILGPTPADVNGVAAIDFLKGMGIAYGIAGMGQLVSSVVKSAVEYDNLMQTTKNILKTHDDRPNFSQRFADMEATIRAVGVETKYTAPEVADASKFLAMAGLDVDAIRAAIRPIADVALVGDTQLGETADVMTNIMTAYGIRPDKMRNAADVMTMTFTKSNTTLMEMAEAYKYSAALLSAGGISFEESAGALGVLGDAGIKGSQAGTSMRTIMANIVNPTKKMKANWDRIGISRTNADGSVRPLVDIFRDLSNAGLYVDDFYKLFNRTAAQGAVALANSVDKWNEIIADNFLSDNISKKLADEKKNTIQGLWAQLSSAFTEDGMIGFEGIQGEIKGALRTGIEWLKSSEAKSIFHEGAKNFIEFGRMMVDSVKQIYTLFSKIGWLLKAYLKYQLYIWPLLSILRGAKSVVQVGRGILSFPAQLGSIGGASGAMLVGNGAVAGGQAVMGAHQYLVPPLFANSRAAWANAEGSNKFFRASNAISAFMGNVPLNQYSVLAASSMYAGDQPVLSKDQKAKMWRETFNKYNWDTYRFHSSGKSFEKINEFYKQNGIAPHGVFAQVNAAYQEKKDGAQRALTDSWLNDKAKGARAFKWARGSSAALSGVMGAGTGLAVAAASDWSPGGWLLGGMTALPSMLAAGGSAGLIGAGAVAIIAIGSAMYQSWRATERAKEALDAYGDSIRTYNGLWVGEGASNEIRQLTAVYNKCLDITEVMHTRIDLMREMQGLSDGGASNMAGRNIDTKAAQELGGLLKETDHWYSHGEMGDLAAQTLNKLLGREGSENQKALFKESKWRWEHPLAGSSRISAAYGSNADPEEILKPLAMATALAVKGEESREIASNFSERQRKALWAHKDLDEILAISRDFENLYGYSAINHNADEKSFPWNWGYDAGAEEKWTGADWSNKYPYLTALYEMHSPMFGQDAPFNAVAKRYFAKRDAGTIDEATIVDFVKIMDTNLGMWLHSYSKKHIEDWFRSLGLDPATGKFGPVTTTNPMTGEKKIFTGQEAAQAVLGFVEQMLKLIPTFTPLERERLSDLSSRLLMLKSLATGAAYDAETNGVVGIQEFKVGDKRTVNDQVWTRNESGKWTMGGSPMMINDKQMSEMLAATKAAGDTGDEPHAPRKASPSGDSLEYKNQYKNQAAAPRQIIIKMDSLMNVESIDLSKPENKEAIANIKEQLSQALLDVVHDFAISSGNMA